MKLPKSIKIGESDYRIAVSDVLDESIAGACHLDSKVILISSKEKGREALATAIHECCHAIECELKIKLGHRVINKIEHALAEIVQQIVDAQ